MSNNIQPTPSFFAKDIDIEPFSEVGRVHAAEVCYTWPMLEKFDNDHPGSIDRTLKEEEMAIVLAFLGLEGYFDRTGNMLDIGTCSGRYPFSLEKKLPNARITGIDANEDCIRYCKWKKTNLESGGRHLSNIQFDKKNFLHDDIGCDKFDFITCMLGTISHFCSNKTGVNDSIQYALGKMDALLSENGILVISNWTSNGLKSNILDIYNDTDREILRRFSPGIDELKAMLELVLEVIKIVRTTDERLDIIFCKVRAQDHSHFFPKGGRKENV